MSAAESVASQNDPKLLRLAEEWGYIAKAPGVRMAREPEGRLRRRLREAVASLDAFSTKSAQSGTIARTRRKCTTSR